MSDHYATLGVARTATQDEIKRAFRKLASQHHPDKGGDTSKFQQIQAAYDTLGDATKRAAYDNPRPQGFPEGFQFHSQPFDFDSIFNMFGTQFNQQNRARTPQARMSLWIQLSDVASGGKRTVSVGSHSGTQIVEIEIPTGIEDGSTVVYPKLAPGGVDLAVTFKIHPNSRWQRNGFNLYTDQKVSIWTLIAGGTITVRDILNRELTVSIPPGTQAGQTLRCRSRGLPDRANNPGDMMIRIQAEIPKNIPDDLLDLIRREAGR
jgi:curved DNA-binding protein